MLYHVDCVNLRGLGVIALHLNAESLNMIFDCFTEPFSGIIVAEYPHRRNVVVEAIKAFVYGVSIKLCRPVSKARDLRLKLTVHPRWVSVHESSRSN